MSDFKVGKRRTGSWMRPARISTIVYIASAMILILASCWPAVAAEPMKIVVQREEIKGRLVIGTISVNGSVIGNVYENDDLKIPAGTYKGLVRYVSGKNFVQGPLGTIGKHGDFLLEVANVHDRTNILFHGGNKPEHSKGCILLGAVGKDPETHTPVLDDHHPLVELRRLFYGTTVPNATPNKDISIEVHDPSTRPLNGKWGGTLTVQLSKYTFVHNCTITIEKQGDHYIGTLTMSKNGYLINARPAVGTATVSFGLGDLTSDSNGTVSCTRDIRLRITLSAITGEVRGTFTDNNGRVSQLFLKKQA